MKIFENFTIIVIVNDNSTDVAQEMPEKKMRSDDTSHEQNTCFNFIAPLLRHSRFRYLLLGVAIAAIAYLYPTWGELMRWLVQRFADVFIDSFIGKIIGSAFRL
jgi:hypothetical protein